MNSLRAYAAPALTLTLVLARPRLLGGLRPGPAAAGLAGVVLPLLGGVIELGTVRDAVAELLRPFIGVASIMATAAAAERLGLLTRLATFVEARTRGPVWHALVGCSSSRRGHRLWPRAAQRAARPGRLRAPQSRGGLGPRQPRAHRPEDVGGDGRERPAGPGRVPQQRHRAVARLCTTPQVGPVTASAFAAAVDNPERFDNAHQVESYWRFFRREGGR